MIISATPRVAVLVVLVTLGFIDNWYRLRPRSLAAKQRQSRTKPLPASQQRVADCLAQRLRLLKRIDSFGEIGFNLRADLLKDHRLTLRVGGGMHHTEIVSAAWAKGRMRAMSSTWGYHCRNARCHKRPSGADRARRHRNAPAAAPERHQPDVDR